jgi:hypothetical protein
LRLCLPAARPDVARYSATFAPCASAAEAPRSIALIL